MAAGAIGAELAAMDIGVAIGTLGTDVLEDQIRVALNAIDFFVHAAEGIPGQIVVELGIGTNGLPACVRVAVGTRGRKRAMRIGDLGLGRIYTLSDRGPGTGIARGIGRVAARFRARITTRISPGVGTGTDAGCDAAPGRL